MISTVNGVTCDLEEGEQLCVKHCRDGFYIRVVGWVINTLKPKVWVEDGVYKFNSRIVHDQSISLKLAKDDVSAYPQVKLPSTPLFVVKD